MTLSELVGANYKQLIKSANAMTKNTDLANDLLSETLLSLHRNNTKLPENENEFIPFFCKCMFYERLGQRSQYNKSKNCREVLIENSYICNIESGEEIDVDDKPDPIEQITEFKNGLDELERLLFELHFESRLSYRKIAKLYSKKLNYVLTTQGVYTLIKPLNQKIKKQQWKF